MFLRRTLRKKDGKQHRYWSVVENRRVAGGRVVQKHLLYLGEINDSQELAWRKSIEILDEGCDRRRTLALFPEDRCDGVMPDAAIVRLKLSELRLCRPRQWGACWLALRLWEELRLDRFWAERLAPSRKGTRWDQVLFVLVAYRLLEPGSEWRLHRQWFERTALADLLGADFGLAEIHKLYRCHDRLLEHKSALFDHLTSRWRDLFNARFDVLLYDLTSTYFEAEPPCPEGDKRRFGYSRDHRSDCVQVVIALVVTPDGLPLAYEVLSGNTSDKTTLRDFLARIERQYGRARRVWLMDRGIPTEEVLAEMRRADPPVQYLVGTPKGRLNRLEHELLDKPWQAARPGVQVKLLPRDGELYVFAESADRVAKERSMRRRQLKWLWARLKELAAMEIKRDDMLMKLGAARPGTDGMASGHHRDGHGKLDVHLLPQPPETAAGPAAGGALPAAQQPHRGRSLPVVGLLSPACPDRTGLQEPQGRSCDPADLSPGGEAHRSPYPDRLLILLPARHPWPAPARPRPRSDTA